MKNFILAICLAFTTLGYAQGSLETGDMQVNGGFGFSNYGLPIYVGMDYGFKEDITLGGEISYRGYNQTFFGVKFKHKIIGFAANANYHFNNLLELPSEFDVYAGLSLGFYAWSTSSSGSSIIEYTGSGGSGLGIGIQIGGRYFFNETWGANLQLGGGNAASGAQIGVTYKL